jgi:hypothetical protein
MARRTFIGEGMSAKEKGSGLTLIFKKLNELRDEVRENALPSGINVDAPLLSDFLRAMLIGFSLPRRSRSNSARISNESQPHETSAGTMWRPRTPSCRGTWRCGTPTR